MTNRLAFLLSLLLIHVSCAPNVKMQDSDELTKDEINITSDVEVESQDSITLVETLEESNVKKKNKEEKEPYKKINEITFEEEIGDAFFHDNKLIYTTLYKNQLEELDRGRYVTTQEEIVFSNGNKFSFEKNERIFYRNNISIYTQFPSLNEGTVVFKRYSLESGEVVLKKVSMIYSSESNITPAQGDSLYFLLSDYGDGGGYVYKMLSIDFEEFNSYIPYHHGYKTSITDETEGRFIILTQNLKDKDSYKFCLVGINGEIEREEEINLGEFLVFSVNAFKDKFLLTSFDRDPYEAHAFLYNYNFDLKWQRVINEPFVDALFFLPTDSYCGIGNNTILYSLTSDKGDYSEKELLSFYSYDDKTIPKKNKRIVARNLINIDDEFLGFSLTKYKKDRTSSVRTFYDFEVILLNENIEIFQSLIFEKETLSVGLQKLDNGFHVINGQKLYRYESN